MKPKTIITIDEREHDPKEILDLLRRDCYSLGRTSARILPELAAVLLSLDERLSLIEERLNQSPNP